MIFGTRLKIIWMVTQHHKPVLLTNGHGQVDAITMRRSFTKFINKESLSINTTETKCVVN